MTRLARRRALLATACAHAPAPRPMTWPALDAKLLADSAETFNLQARPADPARGHRATARCCSAARRRASSPRSSTSWTRRPARSRRCSAAERSAAATSTLSDAEKARRERTPHRRRAASSISMSATTARRDDPARASTLYLIDRATGQRRAIDPRRRGVRPAPVARRHARSRSCATATCWVVGDRGRAAQLTKHPEGFEYGVADFAAKEELDRRRGFWWSPDSKQLAVPAQRQPPVDTMYVADARHPEKRRCRSSTRAPGAPNAIVDLGIDRRQPAASRAGSRGTTRSIRTSRA